MTAIDEREPQYQLVPVPQAAPPALIFGSDDPVQIVARVGHVAKALGDFIRAHGMAKRLESSAARLKREQKGDPPPKEYVFIDGWSFAGQMLGIAAVTREQRDLRDGEGRWYGSEARVELVTRDGHVVGGAIAECSVYEERWQGREPFQIKSMAQTRAVGKAFRTGFGFVMQAAGFESTPGEEFVEERDDAAPRAYGPPAGRQPGPAPRPMQARGEAAGEKRNGVGRVDDPQNVGQLYQAARFYLGWRSDDVATALELADPALIPELVQTHLDGSYTNALRAVLEYDARQNGDEGTPPLTEWLERAHAAPHGSEASEAAPVGAK